ncbi:hypothetical protein [Mesorhizobium salmacidum]|uniref:Uncharacterized protein n=1 Tax=Mesorhizobium salmacidum TaxID=3015171 RepID=A0ABU8L2R2_9HYPH
MPDLLSRMHKGLYLSAFSFGGCSYEHGVTHHSLASGFQRLAGIANVAFLFRITIRSKG